MILKVHLNGLSAYNYPVVDSIKVCIEALVVPPTAVGDLSADVTTVRGAEALLVVVPAERVLHCPAEARHMETVLMLLIFHTAYTHTSTHAQRNTWELWERKQLVLYVFFNCVHWCMAATWSSGTQRVCACYSNPPGGCGDCSLPGCSGHVCVRCPARTLSAGHQNRPCSLSSCGQSSPSHQHAAGSQSSHHLRQKEGIAPEEKSCTMSNWLLYLFPSGHRRNTDGTAHPELVLSLYPDETKADCANTTLLRVHAQYAMTYHLCPYHSRPPQACRPVMEPHYRDLISSLHCNRWKHSLLDNSSYAESLTEKSVRQDWVVVNGTFAPSAGRDLFACWECVLCTRAQSFLSVQQCIGTDDVDEAPRGSFYFLQQERQVMELVLDKHTKRVSRRLRFSLFFFLLKNMLQTLKVK